MASFLQKAAVVRASAGGGGVPAISILPTSWNAGTIVVGSPASQLFTVTGAVTITAISLPAGFSHDAVLPWTVVAGVDDTFTVTAVADDDGVFSGDMEITSDGSPNPLLVALEADVTATLYSDEFTGTVAAPIPAGNADVRGYRVVNDVESLMSIGSGVLAVPAQATAVWGDEYYRAQPSSGQQYWTRPAGKALVAVTTLNHSARNQQFPVGWWTAATIGLSNIGIVNYTAGVNIANYINAVVSDNQTYPASTDMPVVAVWDSTGFHTYVKISGVWHKKWFAPSSVTQAYCGMSNLNSVGSLKHFRIYAVDESLFAPALSIAAPSVGNLANMPDGDFLLYLDNITAPTGGEIRPFIRKKDASNHWSVRAVDNAGQFRINEVVATVSTNRISGSGVVNTDDETIIARGALMQAWRNTTALGSAYTSAYNFLREVGLELNSLGTSGAIGALYAWKSRLLDESGLGAELVVNGDFATDTVWSKGTGWTISAGAAHKAAGTGSNLAQGSILTIGKYYELTFTISNYSAGTLSPFIGGSTLASVNANGTYTVKSVASSSATLAFIADAAFAGSIDNVSCKEILFTADSLALVLDGLAA